MNTKRHIFEFILDNHTRWNYVPTRSQVHQMFAGWSDDLDLHLEQLEREGLLRLGKDDGETISLVPTFPHAQQIGLRGRLANRLPHAGTAYAPGFIALDLRGAGIVMEDDLFALLVNDDSMSDAGIKSNDIAVLKTACPSRGEIAAVQMAGELVLRRYVIVAGIPHLLAENPLRPELVPAHEQAFHGVLWSLIRTEPSSRTCRVASAKVNYQESAALTPEDKFKRSLDLYLNKNLRHADERIVPSASIKHQSGAKKKMPASRRSKKRNSQEWPKPPSGVALNDKTVNTYRTTREKLILDEQPDRRFGQEHADALAQYMKWHEKAQRG